MGVDWRLSGWRVGAALARRGGGVLSFSQEGEDRVIHRLLEGRENGWYVDIGAHHPIRFSNTFALYLRGWRGLNVDAEPGSMAAFRAKRPRDINIECAVARSPGRSTYYRFDDSALNTFDASLVPSRLEHGYRVIETRTIETRPLADVLDRHVPASTTIDLLSVDVEGLDAEVLRSNDWERFRPRLICVESLRESSAESAASVCRERGYEEVAATYNSRIFLARDAP